MKRRPDIGPRPVQEPTKLRAQPTVLVGLDGSEKSWDAFWWARGEADRLGARLIVAFVTPAGGRGGPLAASPLATPDLAVIDACTEEQVAQLREQVDRCGGEGGQLEFVHAEGDAATELLRIAERAHADVIVVGRSRRRFRHLARSIGRRLIAKQRAPVVVVVP